MLVAEIMDTGVTPVDAAKKARLAADLMDLKDVGALPVVDEDHVVGLVTERDIAIRSESAETDPELCTVGQVMSTNTAFCFEDDDVTEAAETMMSAKIGCLPVLSRQKRCVLGILSVTDIAKRYDKTLAGEIIASISAD
jgi:CBS domain-containing protein